MTTAEKITQAIQGAIPDALINVTPGDPGHYALHVRSEVFRGKSMVDSHRLVLAAIAPLMAGNNAPVHAVDRLRTEAP